MELKLIMKKFDASSWDLIAVSAQQWLDGNGNKAHYSQESGTIFKENYLRTAA